MILHYYFYILEKSLTLYIYAYVSKLYGHPKLIHTKSLWTLYYLS